MKKIISLYLAGILSCVLTACDNNSEDQLNTSNTATTNNQIANSSVSLSEVSEELDLNNTEDLEEFGYISEEDINAKKSYNISDYNYWNDQSDFYWMLSECGINYANTSSSNQVNIGFFCNDSSNNLYKTIEHSNGKKYQVHAIRIIYANSQSLANEGILNKQIDKWKRSSSSIISNFYGQEEQSYQRVLHLYWIKRVYNNGNTSKGWWTYPRIFHID